MYTTVDIHTAAGRWRIAENVMKSAFRIESLLVRHRNSSEGRSITPAASQKWCRVLPLLGLLLSSCDIPTALPEWETRWVFDLVESEIGVATLLPSGVTVSPDGEAFLVEIPDAGTTQSLGSICTQCSAVDGLLVPKPAFNTLAQGTSKFPVQLRSADVEGGILRITIRNQFNFDPLRPPQGAAGSMAFTLRSQGDQPRIVAEDVMEGERDAIPAGGVVTRDIPIEAGTVNGDLRFDVQLASPNGGLIRIDVSRELDVTADFVGVSVSSIRAALNGRTINLQPMELNVGGVGQDELRRLEGGLLELRADNPSTATLDVTFEIRNGSAEPIQWEARVPPGVSTSTATFTAEELRRVLEEPGAVLTGTGLVRGPEAGVELRADQKITLSGRMDLGVRLGGS